MDYTLDTLVNQKAGQVHPKASFQSSSGKAILVGEHAVVYGAKAIAMPLPTVQLNISLTPHTSKKSKSKFIIGDKPASERLTGVISDAFDALGIKPFPVTIEGHSKIPIGSGLGSSAALCITMLKTIADSVGLAIEAKSLAELGNKLEKRFHGTPSGLDTAVIAFGKMIHFIKGEEPKTIKVSPVKEEGKTYPWTFALIDSELRSSTITMIKQAAPFFKGRNRPKKIEIFNTLADDVETGLEKGSASKVAQAMNKARELLTEMSIVSTPLMEIMTTLEKIGALAAKPTGAGGGGCILSLLNPLCAEAQIAALSKEFGKHRVYPVIIC